MCIYVLFIQSSPDGTVESVVRKLAKALRETREQYSTGTNQEMNNANNDINLEMKNLKFSIVLLGGATCYNSAKATASQVY